MSFYVRYVFFFIEILLVLIRGCFAAIQLMVVEVFIYIYVFVFEQNVEILDSEGDVYSCSYLVAGCEYFPEYSRPVRYDPFLSERLEE